MSPVWIVERTANALIVVLDRVSFFSGLRLASSFFFIVFSFSKARRPGRRVGGRHRRRPLLVDTARRPGVSRKFASRVASRDAPKIVTRS
jgi:hypothetical protein